MAKERTTIVNEVAKNNDEQGKVSLEVKLPNNDNLVICKVCGHKNPANTGLCEMCSNYLF